MDSNITKRITQNGIEVKIIMRENDFDLHVTITPQADISKKFRCKQFNFKFKLLNGAKERTENLYLKSKRKYQKSSASQYSRFIFKTEEYKCEISLSPQFYVHEEALMQAQEKRKIKRNDKKNISLENTYKPGMASSRPIGYSRSNITKPYSGGRCTPK